MYPQNSRQTASTFKKMAAVYVLTPFTLMVAIMLSGCTPSQNLSVSTPEPAQKEVPLGPEYVDGKGYRFTWSNGMSGVLTIPVEVKAKALEACVENGFITTYMSSIAFVDGAAEGYFGCRGSGGN